ncbi:MAG: hypothetical protein HQL70_08435 [Magnetococcales bacterium]|nr:hypothetical protein [Magnetococcales bacterium]
MKQPRLLLVHGWGLAAGVWRPMLERSGNPPHYCVDFGFFGRGQLDIPTDEPLIAVGHSLGFLWLLKHISDSPWGGRVQGLVSINGFSRFSHADDFPHGVNHCILRRMKNGMQRDPVKVLNDFRVLGGGPPGDLIGADAKKRLDPLALAYGLAWLMEWDCREVISGWDKPFLAIANSDDKVVTPEITNDSFSQFPALQSSPVQWMDRGGHLGLLTRPPAYGALVDKFYRSFC